LKVGIDANIGCGWDRMGLVRQSEMISWGMRLRVRVMSIEILREIDTASVKCDRRMDRRHHGSRVHPYVKR